MLKLSVNISIQSFGDIITNSSSETFCIITSDEKLDDIFTALNTIIKSNGYSVDNLNIDKDTDKETNKEYIRIDIPYDALEYSDIIGAGIEAILDRHFKDKYNIKIKL